MGADGAHPFPGLLLAPVAGGKEDLPARRLQRHGHGDIRRSAVRPRREIAEIVFQEVHAPGGEQCRVLKLVAEGRRITAAGHDPGAGIHAEFEAPGMDIIGHGLHAVGEFDGIRDQLAPLPAPPQAPAVVDHKIGIPGVPVPLVRHGVRHFPDQSVGDIRAEGVPAVPAHGGCRRDHCIHSLIYFN